jgi:chemotaxis protein histidine kinase CheA/ActR/RegA family two-component response regulator
MHTPDNVIQCLNELAGFAATGLVPLDVDAAERDAQDQALREFLRLLDALTKTATIAGINRIALPAAFVVRNVNTLLDRNEALSTNEWTLLAGWPLLALDFARQSQQSAAGLALFDHLADEHWPSAARAEELAAVLPDLDVGDARNADVDDHAILQNGGSASSDEFADAALLPAPDVTRSPATVSEALQRLLWALATLGRFAAMRGLGGLSEVAGRVRSQLTRLRVTTDTDIADVKLLCKRMAIATRGYLSSPGVEAWNQALLDVLTAPGWPQPLNDPELTMLLKKLRAPTPMRVAHEATTAVLEPTLASIDDLLGMGESVAIDDQPQSNQPVEGNLFAARAPITSLTSDGTDSPNSLEDAYERTARAIAEMLGEPTASMAPVHNPTQTRKGLTSSRPSNPVSATIATPIADAPWHRPDVVPRDDSASATPVTPIPDTLSAAPSALPSEMGVIVQVGPSASPVPSSKPFDLTGVEATLAAVEAAAIERNLAGLEEATLRARQGLYALADANARPANDITALIDRFAEVAGAYINAPTATESSEAVVNVLVDSRWPTPLTEEEYALLAELLLNDGESATQAAATPAASDATLPASAPESATIAAPLLDPAVAPNVTMPPDGKPLHALTTPDPAPVPARHDAIDDIRPLDTSSDTAAPIDQCATTLALRSVAAATPVQPASIEEPATVDPSHTPPAQEQNAASDRLPDFSVKEHVPQTTSVPPADEPIAEPFNRTGAEATLAALEALAIERGLLGLEEAAVRARQGLNALSDANRLSGTQLRALIERFAAAAWKYVDTPSALEACDHLVAALNEGPWPQPLVQEEATALASLLLDGGIAAEFGADAEGLTKTVHAAAASAVASPHEAERPDTPDQHDVSAELVALLREEATKLKAGLDDALRSASDATQDAALRRRGAEAYAEEIGRLGDASRDIGLAALGHLLNAVRKRALHHGVNGITHAQHHELGRLMGLLSAYLAAPNEPSIAHSLANILCSDAWSDPMDADAAIDLTRMLNDIDLVTGESDTPTRQTDASMADVSLAVPDDINRELFDTLLEELPLQTAEFSSAVQRLSSDEGSDSDVDVARRAAHTLKGAANTAGIGGIANLTHHVEDILTALFNHGAKPGAALAAVLVDAADCLEAMCEFLSGAGPEPTSSLAVMQTVLNWANRIDEDGIDAAALEIGDDSTPVAAGPVDSVARTADPAAANQATTVARVPITLIDELLRLTGETIISTGQVSDRLQRVVDHVRTIQAQNQTFINLAAEMENLVDVRGLPSPQQQSAKAGEFDALEFEHYGEIHTVSRRLVEAATDAREFTAQVQGDLGALTDLVDGQVRLHLQSQEAVMQTRMVPASNIVTRLQRTVRQSSRQLNKDVQLRISGDHTRIDSQILTELVDPLMHMLRNAIDHGIEEETVRIKAGKPAQGRMDLSFSREGNHIVVRLQDDGAGLDLVAIRRSAESKGLIRADQSLGEDELSRLIMAPGFSTRTAVTQHSGRGVGMDIVHNSVLKLKGAMHLRSTAGKGLQVELRLPAALISTHALQIGVEGRTLTVSTRGIDDIIYAPADQLQSMGGDLSLRLRDEYLSLVDLETLLELPLSQERAQRAAFPVLLVRQASGGRTAIRVGEVISSRDIVVKPLSIYLPKIQGIVGLTVLGDGVVQPVIDLLDLLRAADAVALRSAVAQTPGHAPAREPVRAVATHTVLVVDDSISARRSTARCMADAGFEARTAVDGQDALAILEKWTPDIVLVDMEMPRMNGLELAVALRARPATRETPMIMITSRSTDKHRRQAETAGINLYLTKPFSDDDLVRHALGFVKARAHA